MRRFGFLIAGLLALSACKSEDESADVREDLCGASELQAFVGGALLDATLDPSARIIRPDTAVTQDFRPDRLNVELDENDMIIRISCG